MNTPETWYRINLQTLELVEVQVERYSEKSVWLPGTYGHASDKANRHERFGWTYMYAPTRHEALRLAREYYMAMYTRHCKAAKVSESCAEDALNVIRNIGEMIPEVGV